MGIPTTRLLSILTYVLYNSNEELLDKAVLLKSHMRRFVFSISGDVAIYESPGFDTSDSFLSTIGSYF
jgi:hypothetical protein